MSSIVFVAEYDARILDDRIEIAGPNHPIIVIGKPGAERIFAGLTSVDEAHKDVLIFARAEAVGIPFLVYEARRARGGYDLYFCSRVGRKRQVASMFVPQEFLRRVATEAAKVWGSGGLKDPAQSTSR